MATPQHAACDYCGFRGLLTFKEAKQATLQLPRSFSPSLVLSLSHKFVKHSLITQVPLETCHVEICTRTTKTCHHSSIGSDAVSQRPLVDNAYIVPLQIATTPISLRNLVKATLGNGLVCISAVLSPLSTLTASPPVRSREPLTKPRQTRWFFLMYLNFREYPLTKAVRAEFESVHNWKGGCWDTNSSKTAAIGKVDCTQSAPATTSASPVDRAVAACLRDAQSTKAHIPWPSASNIFQPLVERAVSKQPAWSASTWTCTVRCWIEEGWTVDSPTNPKVHSGLQIFEDPFQAFVRCDRSLGSKPRYKIHCKNQIWPWRANQEEQASPMSHSMNRTSRWSIAPLTFNIFHYHGAVGLP